MFTRSERNTLQELSLQVLGSENAYKKLLKDPKFQVVTGFRETQEPFYYDYVPETNTRTGKQKFRVVRKLNPTNKPIPTKKTPITREMTFDEIQYSLVAASEMKGFQALYDTNQVVFYETVVAKYLDGTIINKPYLHVTESDRPEFDNGFSTIPQNQQDVLKPYITQNVPKSRVFVIDGSKFLSELIYQNLNGLDTNEDTTEDEPAPITGYTAETTGE